MPKMQEALPDTPCTILVRLSRGASIGLVSRCPMHVFLETDRLILRRFAGADADDLYELDSDPDVMLYITGGRTTPREEIESDILPTFLQYYERFEGYGFWAAIVKSTDEFIGCSISVQPTPVHQMKSSLDTG
jgi:RimJ/RimL family protein N-acetyltransferase